MNNTNAQTLRFVVEDAGDSSVGIQPFHEDIVIILQHGGHPPETIKDLNEQLAKFFTEFFCECGGKAVGRLMRLNITIVLTAA